MAEEEVLFLQCPPTNLRCQVLIFGSPSSSRSYPDRLRCERSVDCGRSRRSKLCPFSSSEHTRFRSQLRYAITPTQLPVATRQCARTCCVSTRSPVWYTACLF